jgi:predicted TIM-barrel fold metal-dependent hydrolase
MPPRHFDAHCHVFDLEFLMYEVGQVIWDRVCGRYPIHRARGMRRGREPDLEDYLRWASEIGQALAGDEDENLEAVFAAIRGTWPGCQPCAVPLMMDVYYMFDDPLLDPRERFDARAYAELHRSVRALPDPEGARKSFDQTLEALKVSEVWANKLRARVDAARGERRGASDDPFDTWGLGRHKAALQALAQKYAGSVFPFLAIDPRRAGAIEALPRLVSKHGPFYGVKLYPRLGYHPQHPSLHPVYDFCDQHEIPITTHCGPGGFPPWEKRQELANLCKAEHFEPILRAHPKLRIDFAHFGFDQGGGWRDEILSLMTDPALEGRVFSDLSCFARASDAAGFRRAHLAEWSAIVKQTMFGTDYDVMALGAPGQYLASYHRQFKAALGGHGLEDMSSEVVGRFLAC